MLENKEESFNSDLEEKNPNEKKLVEPDPSPNITWGKELEEVLTSIAGRCRKHASSNINASIRRTRIYNALMYALILSGSLTGILASISDTKNTQIAIISLSVVSGVLSSIVRFSKFSQKANRYGSIGTKFQALAENIERQLKLPQNERVSSQSYLKWITGSYENLFISMPVKTETEDPVKIVLSKEDKELFSDSRMEFELARLHAV